MTEKLQEDRYGLATADEWLKHPEITDACAYGFKLVCEELNLEFTWAPVENVSLIKVIRLSDWKVLELVNWQEDCPDDILDAMGIHEDKGVHATVYYVARRMQSLALIDAFAGLDLLPHEVIMSYGGKWTFRPLAAHDLLDEAVVQGHADKLVGDLEQELARAHEYAKWRTRRVEA
jgi:hypothetical protein